MRVLCKKTKRLLNRAVFLNIFLKWTSMVLLVTASAWLILGLIAPGIRIYTLFMLFLIVPLAPISVHVAGKKKLFYSGYDAAVLVDEVYKNDGSVTSYWENPKLFADEKIFNDLERTVADKLPRFFPLYFLKRYLPVVLFCAAALLIPERARSFTRINEVLDHELGAITEVVQTEKMLEEKDREDIERMLEQIQQQKKGVAREQWEAVEQVKDKLAERLEGNLQKAQMLRQAAKNFSAALKTSGVPGASLSNEQLSKMMESFQSALGKAGNFSDIEIQKMCEEIGKSCSFGQPGDFAIDKESLCKALKELEGELEGLCNGLGQCQCKLGKRPGRGGINRGRGDAEMAFGEDKKLAEAGYEESQLKSKFLEQKDLYQMGITRVEPEQTPGEFVEREAKSFGAVSGGAVSRATISPTQKDIIKRYFSE